MNITINDVAEKAQVSPSTVSRVIHNNPRIGEETKKRVRRVMDQLGYHPNAAARSLARGKTKTIGLIIPNSEEDLFYRPFFIMAMRGISIEVQKRGYNIMYSFSNSETEEVEFLARYVQRNLVDGIILMVSREKDRCMEFLESKKIPYAVIGHPDPEFSGALRADNDNFQAMYRVVTRLLAMGLRRIAFLGGEIEMSVTRDRLRGYREALKSHGIEETPELIRTAKGFSEEVGYDNAQAFLDHQADGIAAADDLLALGALEKMKECGRILPIIGFNNTIKGALQQPSLSSVDIQPDQLGMRAAELLIRKLNGEELPVNFCIVETRLIERDTTAQTPGR